METMRVLYRDVDRTPYLYTLASCARAYGLEIQLAQHQAPAPSESGTGQEWGVLLAEGEVEVISENYWGLQSFRARGAPFVSLASVTNRWTDVLVVAPELHDVRDVEGKKFAVRGGGPNSLFPELWIAESGFEGVQCVTFADREVGRWGHWQRVADGTCEVCMMAGLYLAPALAAGLRVIDYPDVEFAGGNVVLTTTEKVIATRHQEVQKLVAAAFDATALFKFHDPIVLEIMRRDCIPLLSEHFDELGTEVLETMRAVLAGELSDEPVPTAEGIARTRRMRLGTAPELLDFNPLLMWDLSFARQVKSNQSHASVGHP